LPSRSDVFVGRWRPRVDGKWTLLLPSRRRRDSIEGLASRYDEGECCERDARSHCCGRNLELAMALAASFSADAVQLWRAQIRTNCAWCPPGSPLFWPEERGREQEGGSEGTAVQKRKRLEVSGAKRGVQRSSETSLRFASSLTYQMASSAGDRSLSRPMREPKVRRGDETHQDDARQRGSAENSNGQLAFCRVHPCRLRVRVPVLVALETRPAEARQPIRRGINALRRRRHPQSPSADCVAIDSQ
ncbi:hypothetical protein THAOC_25506, partial [Thalassiosira oceanica]